MKRVTAAQVARWRLVSQSLVGPGASSAVEAVRRSVVLQGQDRDGVLTSVALRVARGTRAEVVQALADGHLAVSWTQRGTLHLVRSTDLRWLLDLTAARTEAQAAGHRRQLGIDADVAARARAVAGQVLVGGATRRELVAAWVAAGLDVTGQRAYHLVAHLGQTGVLCLGPWRDGEQLLVLVAEHVPDGPAPDRDEALGDLARRYLSSHGPCSPRDLARWSGLLAADVRTGVALARPHLVSVELDGVELLADPAVLEARPAPRVQLLPGFDELLLGVTDRSPSLAPEHLARVVPGGNGVFRPTVLHGGRVVGTWRTVLEAGVRTLQAVPFDRFAPRVLDALPAVHADLLAR